MDTFTQRKLFVKHEYTFGEEGIDFVNHDLNGEFRKLIKYEEIRPRKECRIYTESFQKILTGGITIFAIGLIAGVIFAGDDLKRMLVMGSILMTFGAAVILSFFYIRIKYLLIELDDKTQLFVIYDKPSPNQVREFVDEIYQRRKEYLRKNYFFIDYESHREKELGKMNLLRSENLISEDEYNVVVDEINENVPEE